MTFDFSPNSRVNLKKTVLIINSNHPRTAIILAGDFNVRVGVYLQDSVYLILFLRIILSCLSRDQKKCVQAHNWSP